MKKLVSIIIPCYNVEKYIDRCMESLLNQTLGLDKIELVFINDASTDGTYEKLLSYEKKYSDSIIVINQSQNRRQGAARNIGIQYSTGESIGFCDSDDWTEPDMFEVMYNVLKKSDVNYVVCARYEEFPNGKQEIFGPKENRILDLEQEEFKQHVSGLYAQGGVYQHLYKREFLEKAGVWFPEMICFEDNCFLGILVYYAKQIATIRKPLYHYCVNSDSTIQAKNKLWHLDRLKSELLRIEELHRRCLLVKYHTDIENQFIRVFFINTIRTFLKRFDEIPSGVVLEMQKIVKSLFPNWKENVLLQNYLSEEEKIFAGLIEYQFVLGNRMEVIHAINESGDDEFFRLTEALLKLMDKGNDTKEEQRYIQVVDTIWESLVDSKKEEIIKKYYSLFALESRKYIMILYTLFRASDDIRIYNAMREYITEDSVDSLYAENIRRQFAAIAFKHNIVISYAQERLINDCLVAKWKKECGKLDSIPLERRNIKTILFVTDQFLYEQHAPTKIVIETMKILLEAEYKVYLLVNNVSYSQKKLRENFISAMNFFKRDDMDGRKVLVIDDYEVTSLQVNYAIDSSKAFSDVSAYLNEIKPQFVWHIGGTCFISDVIGESSTFISTKCTDGYAVSNAPILASLMVGDNEYCHQSIRYIEKTGQKTCHFLSPIASGYEQKKQGVTRKEYGLPEGKFLICLVGNRLDEEINVEFIQWMESVADMSEDILFVTIGTGKTIWKNSGYEDRVVHMGYQKELTDVLSCMDVYVNPPRRGGGGSSVAAMAAGIPAFTLDGCDVAYSVNENFVVDDLEEMKRKVLRCQEDAEFYRQMCKDAKETFHKVKELNWSGEQKKSVLALLKTAEEMSV